MKMILWTTLWTSMVNGLTRCVDCKFFKTGFFHEKKFGTCALFPKEVDDGYEYVTGKSERHMEYSFCVVARQHESMCGNNANRYQKR